MSTKPKTRSDRTPKVPTYHSHGQRKYTALMVMQVREMSNDHHMTVSEIAGAMLGAYDVVIPSATITGMSGRSSQYGGLKADTPKPKTSPAHEAAVKRSGKPKVGGKTPINPKTATKARALVNAEVVEDRSVPLAPPALAV